MDCCPTQILDLGCFNACEAVPISGLNETGAKVVTKFNGYLQTFTGDFNGSIPTDNLNERYTYVVQIYDTNGDVIVINGFDGFRFKLLPPI